MITDVSDESDASIFTVPTVEVEATGAYENFSSINQITQTFIPGYNYLQSKYE
jgi:hypothetical protein